MFQGTGHFLRYHFVFAACQINKENIKALDNIQCHKQKYLSNNTEIDIYNMF